MLVLCEGKELASLYGALDAECQRWMRGECCEWCEGLAGEWLIVSVVVLVVQ
jgi:hypothetical protein